jgi:purine catabolism regulator
MGTLTVGKLVSELGLEIVAGRSGADNPIRWVHNSVEVDPTPWLNGGELLLSSGIQLTDDRERERFIDRLAAHRLAGLGLGLDGSATRAPRALVERAEQVGFPVFEVPRSMPFVTITEKAMASVVNERYDVLRRGAVVQQRLENLVLEERGLAEIAATIGVAVGGAVAILDAAGAPLAWHDPGELLGPGPLSAIGVQVAARGADARPFIASDPCLPDGAFVRPVIQPSGRRPRAWIAVSIEDGRLGELMRLVVQQAVLIVGLELGRSGTASEIERRLTRQAMLDAQGGGDAAESALRLRPFGIGGDVCVLVFSAAGGAEAERALQSALAAERLPAAVATQEVDGREALCAIVEPGERDPLEVAATARAALVADVGDELAVATSRSAGSGEIGRCFREASWALRALGEGGRVASWHDLGPESLLLSVGDPEVLRFYRDRMLGPIEAEEAGYAAELLRSLETFIQLNGQWERAAKLLHCHRHTLRYRIEKIEKLTGRSLAAATDRIEFWLALRARELVA